MNKSKQVAVTGLFAALIILLQFMSGFLKIGAFNLSLVLIPIVLGAVLYGPKVGTILGGVFGAVVVVCCMTGLDPSGAILWAANPFLTFLTCMLKGMAAGFAAGILAKALKPVNRYFACVVAAVAAPIVNTGLFCGAMVLFFQDILRQWAGGTNVFYFTIITLVGINFLIELAVNAIFSPAITRIVDAVKKVKR